MSSNRIAGSLLLAACLVIVSPAASNDSSATLGAGGIELTATDDIALLREDLRISAEAITVRYEFRNVADHDVATTVAFPLPEIDLAELSEVPVDPQTDDPHNFVDFTVSVDGQAIAPQLDVRALLKDNDITDLLLAKKLKLLFFDKDFYPALLGLPAAERQDLTARGVAVYDEYDNVYPQWRVRSAFHWQQTFPAGKTVVIEHRYKPVVGQFFVSRYSLEGDELAAWCVDDGTRRAIEKRIKQRSTTADQEGLLIARAVDYILTTANNWRGPIGQFTLTIDKTDPKRLLTTCLDGLKKTAPTTFVYERTDFVPDTDLKLLFLE